MLRFHTIDDLVSFLKTRQYFSPDYEFWRIDDVIRAVQILARNVKPFPTELYLSMQMDGLPDCLPIEFRSTLICESDSRDFQERFAPEIDLVLRKADAAIDLYE